MADLEVDLAGDPNPSSNPNSSSLEFDFQAEQRSCEFHSYSERQSRV